jgi:hypothetical protein
MSLRPTFSEYTIDQLTLMFKGRRLNLDPGFQRKSVWTLSDRQRLIQSVVGGYPVPSIFFYRRELSGRPVYDVIDGKQRLETILMFMGLGRFKNDWFEVKLDLGDGLEWFDWKALHRRATALASAFRSYQIQTVEVTGDLAQIVDLFVRINSTGKRLTSGEKRHARFYTSPFLKEAERLVSKHHKYLRENRILSPAQIDRMKGTELFAELLMSIHHGGPINKKTSLDRAIGNDSVNGNTLHRLTREFTAALNLLKAMFPDLKQTRFRNSAEFYSLFMLIWEMNAAKFALKDRKRNGLAFELLKRLSSGVDQLREQLRRARPGKPQKIHQDYLLTVQGDTDSAANRERRRALLKGLLWTIYERKDDKRTFSTEQRRILWNSDERRICPKCRKPLSWLDVTVDHIRAWSKGGKTSLKNAQLMHRSCNASKGAR